MDGVTVGLGGGLGVNVGREVAVGRRVGVFVGTGVAVGMGVWVGICATTVLSSACTRSLTVDSNVASTLGVGAGKGSGAQAIVPKTKKSAMPHTSIAPVKLRCNIGITLIACFRERCHHSITHK